MDGDVLIADSASPFGVKFAALETPGAEPAGFHGCRARYYTGIVPSGQNVANGVFTPCKYNYTGAGVGARRSYDTDGYHPVLDDTNLTGAVAKTAGSPSIVGTGTLFTTELRVGDPVKISGGSVVYYPDVVVVKSIEDDTHFTAYQAPGQTAAGQTATKDSTVFVIPPGLGGYYAFTVTQNWRGNSNGLREMNLVFNGLDAGNQNGSNSNLDEACFTKPPSGPAEQCEVMPAGPVLLAEGEFVQNFLYQDSGVPLQTAADLIGYPFTMWLVGRADVT